MTGNLSNFIFSWPVVAFGVSLVLYGVVNLAIRSVRLRHRRNLTRAQLWLHQCQRQLELDRLRFEIRRDGERARREIDRRLQ